MRKPNRDEARPALRSLLSLLERLNLARQVVRIHAARVQSKGLGAFDQGDVRGHASGLKVGDGSRFLRKRCGFLQSFLELTFASSKCVGQLRKASCTKEHEEHDDDDQDLWAADGRHDAQSGVSARSLQGFVLNPAKSVKTKVTFSCAMTTLAGHVQNVITMVMAVMFWCSRPLPRWLA